jgi:NAD(P)-dependent dehydrogenase (short-subunit alcohol dehydrogenase family)
VQIHLADVAERPSLARLARDLKGEPIDLLICNAAVLGPRDAWLGNTDYAAWEQMHRVNVMGPMATVEALVDNVASSARKQIVLMSSGAGSLARHHNPLKTSQSNYLYRTSKVAVNSLMLSLTQMLADRHVTVISMAPGWVRTEMGGPNAMYGAEESVAGMRNVIERLTLADSGHFYRLTGEQAPW